MPQSEPTYLRIKILGKKGGGARIRRNNTQRNPKKNQNNRIILQNDPQGAGTEEGGRNRI